MQGEKTREGQWMASRRSGRLKQLALRLDANEQQAHPRPPNRLLERTIVRRTPPHRASGNSTATLLLLLILILGRLKLRTASGERGHRARVAVTREKEKGGAWGESGVQRRELLVEISDGLEQDVLLFLFLFLFLLP